MLSSLRHVALRTRRGPKDVLEFEINIFLRDIHDMRQSLDATRGESPVGSIWANSEVDALAKLAGVRADIKQFGPKDQTLLPRQDIRRTLGEEERIFEIIIYREERDPDFDYYDATTLHGAVDLYQDLWRIPTVEDSEPVCPQARR